MSIKNTNQNQNQKNLTTDVVADTDTDNTEDGSPVSDVVAFKTDTADKLSLRSNGLLTYQLGYVAAVDQLFVRIQSNETGGYFSKEWVPFEEVSRCLEAYGKSKESFTAVVLKSAFLSKSQNNAGFLAAVLKSEGLLHCVSGKSNLLCFDSAKYQSWLKQQFALAKKNENTPSKPEKTSQAAKKPKPSSTTKPSPTAKGKSSSMEDADDLSTEEAAILNAVSVGT